MKVRDILKIFKKDDSAVITKVNIHWKNKMHQLEGMQVKTPQFEINLPFSNRNSGEFAIPGLKLQKKGDETIKAIEISEPFKLISTVPAMPLVVKPGQKVDIKINVERPTFGWEGPIAVKLIAEAPDNIKVEITRQIMRGKNGEFEIPNTAEIMSIERGNIFKKEIQMMKAISFGTEVRKVEVNKPFKLVSTDPKLPFKIDDSNSYIVAFYIQAPDFNYAGPLEFDVE